MCVLETRACINIHYSLAILSLQHRYAFKRFRLYYASAILIIVFASQFLFGLFELLIDCNRNTVLKYCASTTYARTYARVTRVKGYKIEAAPRYSTAVLN